MIISEEIEIVVSKPNIKFYREKYKCKVGDKIKINVEDLSSGSEIKIKVCCDVCNLEKDLSYRKYLKNVNKQGYYTCSSKCSRLKVKQTCLTRFGVDNPMKLDIIKTKVQNTCLEKYGDINFAKTNLYEHKRRNKCLEKYNHPTYVGSEEFKKNMIDSFGLDNPMKSSCLNQKRIKSSFKSDYFGEVKYQGKYELDFLKLCDKLNISIERPGFSINYFIDGEERKYIPDFFIQNKNLIIEVKSTYFYNLHLMCNIQKKKYTLLSGYEYLLILDRDYVDFLSSVSK